MNSVDRSVCSAPAAVKAPPYLPRELSNTVYMLSLCTVRQRIRVCLGKTAALAAAYQTGHARKRQQKSIILSSFFTALADIMRLPVLIHTESALVNHMHDMRAHDQLRLRRKDLAKS